MYLIRPIKKEDLKQVLELAKKTGPGMTSLPADEKLLKSKIQNSVNSFKIDPVEPRTESYRFVLIDSKPNKIIGIAAISARIGGYEPFYSYEIKKARHVSKGLNVDKEIAYLELKKEHDGPSLIGSLFLDPEYRGQGLGKFLSQARFFFMANFPNRFADSVIAEMRGVINDKGESPFWNGTVRHFFDMDFTKADYLSITDKGFIADLMPHYPIYIPLLKESTQEAIAQVHENTKPAMKFLLKEGFKPDDHVDIFDAGPRIEAKVSELKTIKESKTIKVSRIVEELDSPQLALISNLNLEFRFIKAGIVLEEAGAILDKKSAENLELGEGSEIRYLV